VFRRQRGAPPVLDRASRRRPGQGRGQGRLRLVLFQISTGLKVSMQLLLNRYG